MRLFLAIDLSDEVRSTLTDAASWMARFHGLVKVVWAKNYHVTLKFLGSTPQTSEFAVTGLTLYESNTTALGPVYTSIAKMSF